MNKGKSIVGLLMLLLGLFLLLSVGIASAREPLPADAGLVGPVAATEQERSASSPDSINAACAGGPTIDGVLLDECVENDFIVGGVGKRITVWYTNNPVTATRMVDGNPVVLSHWVNTDAQANQVAEWFEDAWLQFYSDSNHHLYDTGCGNNVNVRLEDGVGWAGIAYWASSGSCWIGIDSPMVRGGGGQRTVYHEAQHYLQYSFNAGCYASWKPNYPDNAEFVEGYADYGSNSVDATVDANYHVGSYNVSASMYDKGYGNLFPYYLGEQLGTLGGPSDRNYHVDAMYEHYARCDVYDDLYVLDSLIPALGGPSKQEFFMNFFASLWARNWSDPVTQRELAYLDDDDDAFADPTLTQNVSMSGGSNSWSSSTPDDWAARYFQVRPQTGCPYLQVEVDGAAGATLGINLMAADTSAPTLLRSAWIGEDFVRTFAGAGVHDRVVAVVNSFTNNYNFDVDFTCATPTLNILEPRQVDFALVGAPDSPIAFLARLQVTSGGAPVRGLPESSFSFDAGGDAITVVAGTLQEVGDEYWAVLMPPTKPAGTSFVNFQACLDGATCDTETNALLYVEPGNTNTAFVFDASGSMGIEDVSGEGERYVNAQKAGMVLADLLRTDDRVLVLDFSALDSPSGCGIDAGGSGDCALDIQTYLARTDVAAGTIAAVKTAIDKVNPRDWTPIGEGLMEAKDQLVASPSNSNPNYIFLLSDGQENVNRLYADVKANLIASGVVINTIGFGPEAPGALLAQIAADTGGQYRPVPTTYGGLRAPSVATLLPGQLGLADVYVDFDTEAQGASRVAHANFTGQIVDYVPVWQTQPAYIDESTTRARFVVAGKQPDFDVTGDWSHSRRLVEVLMPGGDPKTDWIPISPAGEPGSPPAPADWDIRNGVYDDVLIVPNPTHGVWQIRAAYQYVEVTPVPADFMINISLQSTIHLEGRLLGLNAMQGKAGDPVTILGTLMHRTGTIAGAVMTATIDKPWTTDMISLYDDGNHGDGQAGDGIYGQFYPLTTIGGSYNVSLEAAFKDPAGTGEILHRYWNGGFWIDGPEVDDTDNDGMPDEWEKRCDVNPEEFHDKDDLDRDGLSNVEEFWNGTIPCDPDTDDGGEKDGSEVRNERNPLWPEDDQVLPLLRFSFRPLNAAILIRWTHPLSYTNMTLFASPFMTDTGEAYPLEPTGVFTLTGIRNDQPLFLRLAGANGSAEGPMSQPQEIVPKADPDPPSGWLLVSNGITKTTSREVTLHISSSDTPPDGAVQGANAHLTDRLSLAMNEVTGDVVMRVSNDGNMTGAEWEPLAEEKPWTLECEAGEVCLVYAQFRDGAGNESTVVHDEILYDPHLVYLPLVIK